MIKKEQNFILLIWYQFLVSMIIYFYIREKFNEEKQIKLYGYHTLNYFIFTSSTRVFPKHSIVNVPLSRYKAINPAIRYRHYEKL